MGSVVLISWASEAVASELAAVLSAVLAASLEAAGALLAAVPQPASRVAAMAAATPREIAFFMFCPPNIAVRCIDAGCCVREPYHNICLSLAYMITKCSRKINSQIGVFAKKPNKSCFIACNQFDTTVKINEY